MRRSCKVKPTSDTCEIDSTEILSSSELSDENSLFEDSTVTSQQADNNTDTLSQYEDPFMEPDQDIEASAESQIIIEEIQRAERPTSSPAQLDSTTNYTTVVVTDHPLNNSEVSFDHNNPNTVESTGTTDNIEYIPQGQITKMPAVASTDCSKNPQSELCVQIRNTYIPTKVIPSGESTPDSDHDPCGDTLATAASSNCLNWGGLRSSGLDEFLQSMKKGNLDVFPNDEASMFNKRKFTNFQTATSMLKDTKLLGARTAFGLLIGLATNILSQTRQHRVEGSIYQKQDEERNYLLSIPSFVLALLYMLICQCRSEIG